MVILPYQYQQRDYQWPLWHAMFEEGKKRAIMVWHRRAGKDKTCLNIIISKAMERVGAYYYLFPQLNQARRNIWEAIDREGKRFIDHFPQALIAKKPNDATMTITFKNGSLFQLLGADEFNSKMGANPVGIVLSEYSLQNPQAWELLRPILVENGGWAIFNYTPRGKNHGWELYANNLNNPKWFVQVCTVADTRRHDGSYVMSPEDIEEERRSGMSDDLIEQEFYCSFEAAVPGAYFARQLKQALEQKRICDFAIDPALPVSTYWDLGLNDSTAIWFVQHFRHNEIRLVHYYENNNESLAHYANYLNEFAAKHNIVYGQHWWPHDGKVREFGTGEQPEPRDLQMRRLGYKVEIVERTKSKADAIEAARSLFARCWFHETNCKRGIAALTEFHKEYDEVNKVYKDYPHRNWAKHGSDAFLQLAQSYYDDRQQPEQAYIPNAVNTEAMI